MRDSTPDFFSETESSDFLSVHETRGSCLSEFLSNALILDIFNKKLSYRRGTARCVVVSVDIGGYLSEKSPTLTHRTCIWRSHRG